MAMVVTDVDYSAEQNARCMLFCFCGEFLKILGLKHLLYLSVIWHDLYLVNNTVDALNKVRRVGFDLKCGFNNNCYI